jgi:hypothetical protein
LRRSNVNRSGERIKREWTRRRLLTLTTHEEIDNTKRLETKTVKHYKQRSGRTLYTILYDDKCRLRGIHESTLDPRWMSFVWPMPLVRPRINYTMSSSKSGGSLSVPLLQPNYVVLDD